MTWKKWIFLGWQGYAQQSIRSSVSNLLSQIKNVYWREPETLTEREVVLFLKDFNNLVRFCPLGQSLNSYFHNYLQEKLIFFTENAMGLHGFCEKIIKTLEGEQRFRTNIQSEIIIFFKALDKLVSSYLENKIEEDAINSGSSPSCQR